MEPTSKPNAASFKKVIAKPLKVERRCAFCRGTGKDPFGILSWESTCCVCQGKGRVPVEFPYVRCAHCQGTGAVKTFTCTVCGGKGLVPAARGPTVRCPECRGSGDAGIPSLTCLRCRGRGWICRDSHRLDLESPDTQNLSEAQRPSMKADGYCHRSLSE